MAADKKTSSSQRGREAVYEALHLIEQNGGVMRLGDIVRTMRPTFPANEYERERGKNGYERWDVWLSFYSIDAKAAGWLEKTPQGWRITPEGQEMIKLPQHQFVERLKSEAKLKEKQPPISEVTKEALPELDIERVRAQAEDSVRAHLASLSPYQFQDLVAALLRAMGYHTPFVAAPGKDGGVDVIAYTDPLGAGGAQLKVQVKHYPDGTVGWPVVQQLGGTLLKDNEVGLVVTSGTFSKDARMNSRSYPKQVRLIDFNDFRQLWIDYYHRMPEEDKALMPIEPIYFIKVKE